MNSTAQLYDVFISHASEDKDSFVRPLAERLREEHIEVWYDEFSLKLGDSLRRAVDLGLSRSRYGVVVLSPAFLAKRWTQHELDGLFARELNGDEKVLLPIWHMLTKEELLRYSPPLADRFAADSARGLAEVVRQIVAIVRPRGSPLVIARDDLLGRGLHVPVVTDEWWLDVVEASNREIAWGFATERPHWGRWTFPLPPEGPTPEERGFRLALTALQMDWEAAAERERVCQVSEPAIVHEFIGRHEGLGAACHQFPHFLAVYAPQLTIPGFGGEFEDDFDALEAASAREREELALRKPDLTALDPAVVACHFVQGPLHGPTTKLFEVVDYLFWLLSSKSRWLPGEIRELLTIGMKQWGAWIWHQDMRSGEGFAEPHEHAGALLDSMWDPARRGPFKLSSTAAKDTIGRATMSAKLLGLPESGEELGERFLKCGFIASKLRSEASRRKKKPTHRRRPP